ncbi:MAG: DUF285 domain-containing protein [Candidatus Peribacteria bacterium]|nr:DUF285 domain-containing protein [Candidatus Peribacteria bacterium]
MKTIKISGTFPRIYINNGTERNKLLSIDQWGTIEWTSMANAFNGASTMQILASDVPDVSKVTTMQNMFYNATNFNSDLNNWDVSNVTTMQSMFYNAKAFNGSLSGRNTASLT